MSLPKTKSTVAPSSIAPEKASVVTQRRVSRAKSELVSKEILPPSEPDPSPANIVEKAVKKEKRVRVNFSVPESQILALSELKARCLRLGISAKKGEVLVAAIQLLKNLPEASFTDSILPYLNSDRKVPNGKMRKK